jgi:hypothetical protein
VTDPIRLHPDNLDAIVRSVADAVRNQSPWKTADEAAEYIRAPLSRVRKRR